MFNRLILILSVHKLFSASISRTKYTQKQWTFVRISVLAIRQIHAKIQPNLLFSIQL
jgi:hypothetical protein